MLTVDIDFHAVHAPMSCQCSAQWWPGYELAGCWSTCCLCLQLLAGWKKFNFLICFEVAASYLMIELSVSFIQFHPIFNFVFVPIEPMASHYASLSERETEYMYNTSRQSCRAHTDDVGQSAKWLESRNEWVSREPLQMLSRIKRADHELAVAYDWDWARASVPQATICSLASPSAMQKNMSLNATIQLL